MVLKEGDTYEHNVSFKQNDVDTFAKITEDNNPIHIDKEYASRTIFGQPIVHGFLAGSVFSKVFGTLWPGEGTIYLYQEMIFLAPVFVDRNYIANFIVIEINAVKHKGVIKCILEDSDGKQVITGIAKLMHREKF